MIRAINRSFSVLSQNCCAIKDDRLVQNRISSVQIKMHRSYTDIAIKNWIETLSEPQKERVRFIQNEVRLSGT